MTLEEMIEQKRVLDAMITRERKELREVNKLDPGQMTTEQKLKEVHKLPELSDSLHELLTKEGFATGSSEYTDCQPADWDWCIAVPPHVFDGFALGSDNNYWIADGFTSLYAHKDGNYLNILCFSDYPLMQAWYMTTQYMTRLTNVVIYPDSYKKEALSNPLKDAFNTKWKRVMVFRALKDILWPVKKLNEIIPKADALKRHQCMLCGREAINFTNKGMREQYQLTGICERCEPEPKLQNGSSEYLP